MEHQDSHIDLNSNAEMLQHGQLIQFLITQQQQHQQQQPNGMVITLLSFHDLPVCHSYD